MSGQLTENYEDYGVAFLTTVWNFLVNLLHLISLIFSPVQSRVMMGRFSLFYSVYTFIPVDRS